VVEKFVEHSTLLPHQELILFHALSSNPFGHLAGERGFVCCHWLRPLDVIIKSLRPGMRYVRSSTLMIDVLQASFGWEALASMMSIYLSKPP
jgi:hypothetical protein